MKRIKILVVLTFSLFGIAFAQNDKKVAVFDPSGDVPNNLKTIIREELSNAVVNTLGFTVLERELINKVLAESQFQMTGHVDDGQIGELGKKMGANYVCYATISSVGENYYISCKMVDVLSARIERQNTGITKNGLNDLFTVIASVSRLMLQQGGGAPVEVLTATPQKANTVHQAAKKQPNPNDLAAISVYGMELLIMPNDISPERITWADGNKGCENTTEEGYDDWRMPNKVEIQAMYKNKHQIKGMKPYWYWSSSSKGEVKYRHAFDAEKLALANPAARFHVRCVRGNGASKDDNTQGVKAFNVYGKELFVMPTDIIKIATWKEANEGCQQLNAYGFDDWFLPKIEDLEVLYTNKHGFNMNSKAYWSSSEKKTGAMYEKNFENGRTYDTGISGERSVRCVRSN